MLMHRSKIPSGSRYIIFSSKAVSYPHMKVTIFSPQGSYTLKPNSVLPSALLIPGEGYCCRGPRVFPSKCLFHLRSSALRFCQHTHEPKHCILICMTFSYTFTYTVVYTLACALACLLFIVILCRYLRVTRLVRSLQVDRQPKHKILFISS